MCWDTRIRTWKTGPESVVLPLHHIPISYQNTRFDFDAAKIRFLFNPQIFEAFFLIKILFLHLLSFPAFLILLDRVSSL